MNFAFAPLTVLATRELLNLLKSKFAIEVEYLSLLIKLSINHITNIDKSLKNAKYYNKFLIYFQIFPLLIISIINR